MEKVIAKIGFVLALGTFKILCYESFHLQLEYSAEHWSSNEKNTQLIYMHELNMLRTFLSIPSYHLHSIITPLISYKECLNRSVLSNISNCLNSSNLKSGMKFWLNRKSNRKSKIWELDHACVIILGVTSIKLKLTLMTGRNEGDTSSCTENIQKWKKFIVVYLRYLCCNHRPCAAIATLKIW